MKSIFKKPPIRWPNLPSVVMRSKDQYSTQKISEALIGEIKAALHDLDYGSVEVYVVDNKVTQITRRHIKKTNHRLTGEKK